MARKKDGDSPNVTFTFDFFVFCEGKSQLKCFCCKMLAKLQLPLWARKWAFFSIMMCRSRKMQVRMMIFSLLSSLDRKWIFFPPPNAIFPVYGIQYYVMYILQVRDGLKAKIAFFKGNFKLGIILFTRFKGKYVKNCKYFSESWRNFSETWFQSRIVRGGRGKEEKP